MCNQCTHNEELKKFLNKCILGLSKTDERLVHIYNTVRDIHWKSTGSRDPIEVIRNNAGTCSGKHVLLKKLYKYLGIEVGELIAVHRFSTLSLKIPFYLQDYLKKNPFIDYHNFIKINHNNRWIIVDATWDKSLEKIGFPISKTWDGLSNTVVCVNPIDIIEVENSIEYKKDLLKKMNLKEFESRRYFLKELSEYLEYFRDN